MASAFPWCMLGSNINPPFNTGENTNLTLATMGVADPHYTAVGSTVFVLSAPNGGWVGPGAGVIAQYVGPDTGDGSSFMGGVYTLDYLVSFDLTGFDPATVSLSGKWSTDNLGNNIFVNGTATGNTSSGFGSLSSFTINSGFIAGVNTLDFKWSNQGGPGGILVEFNSATGTASGVPEPSSVFLFSAGLAGLWLTGRFARRRRHNGV